jgi:hypothetical protein
MITTQRSSHGFVHEVEIGASVAAVREVLADLDAQAEFHPLIESIEEIAPRAERPDARHHRVTDRILLGPFRFRVTYHAALEALSDTEVRGDAWQQPGIRLRTIHSLTESDVGTKLVETVEIEAPRLLRRFTVSQACAAHRVVLEKLKARLEAG